MVELKEITVTLALFKTSRENVLYPWTLEEKA